MARFGLHDYNLEAGNYAGRCLIVLKLADTAGYRARLRSLYWCGGWAASDDQQIVTSVAVADNNSDATGGADVSGQIFPMQADIIATRIASAKTQCSAMPTVVQRVVWQGVFNGRAPVFREWNDPRGAIVWGPNETLVVTGWVRAGNTIKIQPFLTWEEF